MTEILTSMLLSVIPDKLVYKSADKYIITLKLDPDSKTNENRENIVDPLYAKFRCNRAFVVEIRHKFTNQLIDSVRSDQDGSFIYEKEKYVTVDNYNENYNEVCTNGIHYYLTQKAAFNHNLNESENGIWESRHDNGRISEKCNYMNGARDGLYESWHLTGQIREKCTYVNGNLDGLYESWHCNGQMSKKCNTMNGNIDGLYESWHDNGKIYKKCNYVNGNLGGFHISWHNNGQIYEKCNYVNGKIDGLYESWHDNGQIDKKCNYVNGRNDGLYESWHSNGQIYEKCNYVNGKLDCYSWRINGQKQ